MVDLASAMSIGPRQPHRPVVVDSLQAEHRGQFHIEAPALQPFRVLLVYRHESLLSIRNERSTMPRRYRQSSRLGIASCDLPVCVRRYISGKLSRAGHGHIRAS